jgi:hypothetical protein
MKKDLLPLGLLYTLIILLGMYLSSVYKFNKEQSYKLQAMELSIEINNELEKSEYMSNLSIDYLVQENLRLKNKLSEYKHVDSIVKDIRRIK